MSRGTGRAGTPAAGGLGKLLGSFKRH